MPSHILMPALSPTMEEGNLVKWTKNEGDKVKAGQVIAEIETDKATMEVEAPEEGKLVKILVPAGTSGVKVASPIAILTDMDEDKMTADEAFAILAKKFPAPKMVTPPPAAAPSQALTIQMETAASPVETVARPTVAAPMPQAQPSTASRLIASPLAKRIAEQSGINLHQIAGTGPNGRIVKADVEGYLAKGAPMVARGSVPANKMQTSIPHTGMRKTIARRLTESKQQVPHFYLTIDCDIDALLALRKQINTAKNSKLSVNDCIIKAVALALQQVPAANASWTDDAIIQYPTSDISVAVATPGGLITPIVKQAENKTLLQISNEMKDLATRAREGKLRPEEYQGGGFTISNLGMFGIRDFAAIINPPQACILAVGAGEQRAVVKEGQLAVATVMTCTLSIDHRAVDGAIGAEFLAAFKKLIENPIDLVL